MKRKLLAIALLLAGLLALVAFGLFPHAPLERRLEASLGRALGGSVRIGSLRIVPARLSAEARDVTIDSPTLRARVAELRLRATTEALEGRVVALRSLAVRGVDVEIRPAAAPSPSAPVEKPPAIRIDQLDVDDVKLRYADPALGGDVLLSGIRAQGAIGSGALDLTIAEGRWEREPEAVAASATARLEIAPDLSASLTRAEVALGASRVEVAGSLGLLTSPTPELRFQADLESQDVTRIAGSGTAVRGRARIKGRVLGRAPITWEADFDAPSLAASGLSLSALKGRASGTAASASGTASAGLLGGQVWIEGQRRGEAVELRLQATDVRPSGVPVTARAEIAGTAAAKAIDLRFSLHGEARPSAAIEGGARLSVAVVDAAGSVAGAEVPVVSGTASAALSLVAADGAERTVPLDGSFRFRGAIAEEIVVRLPEADLAGIMPGLEGSASLTADARGPLDRLSGSARLTARGLAWRGLALGMLDLEGSSRAGDWMLDARVPDHGLRIDARSPLPTRGERQASGNLTFADTALAGLGPLLPESVPRDGRLEGRIEFQGPIARPAAMSAQSAVTLSAERYSARVDGRFGAAPSSALDLHLTGTADLAAFERSDAIDVAGTLEADMRVRGTRLAPEAEGEARVLRARVTGQGVPPLSVDEARVALDRTGVELKPTTVALADGSMTASGRYPLAGSAPAELHLEWTGFRVEKLMTSPEGAGETEPLSGRVSGRADLTGTGTELKAWRGEATVALESLSAADMALELTPLRLRLDAGQLTAEPVILTSGPGSLTMGGRVDLVGRGLDLEGRGTVDLRALSPLVGTASLSGVAEIDLAVGGTLDAPVPRGALVLKDASARARDIPEALTKVEGRIVVDGSSLRIEDMRAALGGGDVTISGEARLKGATFEDARIEIQGRNLNLRYPVGLKSRLDADLALIRTQAGFVLRGDVRVQRGLYDLDLALGDAVKAPVVEPQPSPMLRAIGLDVRVVLENAVLVRNRLATVDVTGNLQFRGDLETPAPFGRLDLEGGGRNKIYLRGRGFSLAEGGGLTYRGDWDPEVKIRASLKIPDQSDQSEPQCSVQLEGLLSTAQPTLGCEGLSQGQALSLVATGNSSGGAGRLGAQVAGEQAASFALGHLSQGLGFEEVVVQPELLARDTEPGARFTFGKQLTRVLSLIYSISLQGPEQRFVQLEARLPRGVSVKGQRTDDGFFAAGVGQRIRIGRARKPRTEDERVRLEEVRFEGDVPEAARSAARSKKGRRVAAWDVQEDADRVRRALVERGHVEAEVSGRLEGGVAVLRVEAGPRFAWRVVGMVDPPDLAEAFRDALYEEDAIERARERIVSMLRERGFLRGRVATVRPDMQDALRTLVFEVDPGPQLEAEVAFPGADALPARRLLAVAGGPGALLMDGQTALAKIEDAYRKHGRLAARAGPVQVQEDGSQVRITVPVKEGEPPRIAGVTFEGASLPQEELLQASGLVAGAAFEQDQLTTAQDKVRRHYYARGYAQVGVSVENAVRGADVEVRFRVREGTPTVVGAVQIVGLRQTRESVVRGQIRLRPGEPVDPRRLARVEQRILELGVFSSVLVSASPENPSTITVEVVEKDRAELAYDLRWSEDQNTTAQVDAELRNIGGFGLDLGARYRFGADDREKRASLHLPSILRGKLTVAAFETQEDFEATDPFSGEPITNTQTERVVEVQHSQRVRRTTTVLAGYRFKSVFSDVFPIPIHIATLLASGIRETRDNILDARRGQFAALNLELSPQTLGSDLTFVKGFGQFFLHRRIAAAWTWSQAYRLGLAKGFDGQEVIPSERFHAGGPDSLRGFTTDSVGPKDFLGEPAGGDAVLILNQELRYRHASGWGFAVFWDFGNVFEHVEDLSLDLRHDLGAGLRWASPVGMLRFDLAFPLDRQPDEDRYHFTFSLGQVF